MIRRLYCCFFIFALCLTACGDDDPASDNDQEPDPTNQGDPTEPADYPLADCDDLNPEVCAFPWPSNLYQEPDEDRASGFRFRFTDASLPTTTDGVPFDPTLFDHLDGYDLGVPIMVSLGALDDTDLPGEYAIEDSMNDDAPIILFQRDGNDLRRVPYWAELDATEDTPDDQTLFIRPAELLEPSTDYLVALRDLQRPDGEPIEPSDAFSQLLDGDHDDPVLLARQERFDRLFDDLHDEGIDPQDLLLAWDFRTGSSDAIHGPLLQMRDDAMSWIDDHGLHWRIDDAQLHQPDDPNADDYDPFMAIDIEATVEIPHFMIPYEAIDDGWRANRHPQTHSIDIADSRTIPVAIRIPYTALDGDPMGTIVYGHGLFGSRHEILTHTTGRQARELDYIMVGADLSGMSQHDLGAAEEAAQELSHFQHNSDRVLQGIVEYLILLEHAPSALPDLDLDDHLDDPPSLSVDPQRTRYVGASQGGIFGTTVMALTQATDRGALAVPGNNFSTLLQRSTNFDLFTLLMSVNYPDSRDRNLNLGILSLLWSTSDPVGFLRHIEAQPFDDDPRHILLLQAKGDYQVATITNENTARSRIDIPLLEPYDEDRLPYGAHTATYPHTGSGIVHFDFGNPWPDRQNRPPEDDVGDPHSWPALVDETTDLIGAFLDDGTIIDVCDGDFCQLDRF